VILAQSVEIGPDATISHVAPTAGPRSWLPAVVSIAGHGSVLRVGPQLAAPTPVNDRASADVLRRIAAAAIQGAEWHEARAREAADRTPVVDPPRKAR